MEATVPMAEQNLAPAIFLDRDGTLIKDLKYMSREEQVSLLPGAVPALLAFQKYGFKLIVVSNQSGVARGLISLEQAAAVHSRFVTLMLGAGVAFDGVYYCYHAPGDGCGCRKPSPGLVYLAAQEHNIDLPRSVFIGDQSTDAETGTNAGIRSLLLSFSSDGASGWNEIVKDILGRNLENPGR